MINKKFIGVLQWFEYDNHKLFSQELHFSPLKLKKYTRNTYTNQCQMPIIIMAMA